jgi:hypothetical protein
MGSAVCLKQYAPTFLNFPRFPTLGRNRTRYLVFRIPRAEVSSMTRLLPKAPIGAQSAEKRSEQTRFACDCQRCLPFWHAESLLDNAKMALPISVSKHGRFP